MIIGETLFIIAPSNIKFAEITKQSIFRHPELNHKKIGLYVLDETNKNEWNISKNKYINILNICEKYKNYYDTAFILSDNIFYHNKSGTDFQNVLENVFSEFLKNKKLLVIGPSFINQNEVNVDFDHLNMINVLGKNDINYIKNIIDYDFCFVDLNKLNDFISISSIYNNLNFNENISNELIINSILLNNSASLQKKDDILFKTNISTSNTNSNVLNLIKEKNKSFFKFTANKFPLKNLKDESDKFLNLLNYYIFNKLYEELQLLDKSKIDEELVWYIEETYFKTFFTKYIP